MSLSNKLIEKSETRQTRVLLLKIILEKHISCSGKKAVLRLANLSLQSSKSHKPYLHLNLITKYAFVIVKKTLTFCPMGYQDLVHLNAFQVKMLLYRKYAVLTLANELSGFVISVEYSNILLSV